MKFKAKGRYEWRDLPHHKNHSALIVKMAAEEFLLHGVDPEEFIRNHENIYDFMLRVKVPRSSKLVLVDNDGVDHQVQNISRYYVSNNGMEMFKVMPPLQPTKTEHVYVDHATGDEVVISSKTDIAKYEKKGYTFSHDVETVCEDRRLGIEAGNKVVVTNDIKDFVGDIDYSYYVNRTWKLVNFADENSEDIEETSE